MTAKDPSAPQIPIIEHRRRQANAVGAEGLCRGRAGAGAVLRAAVDLQHSAESAEEREQATLLLDILTPVAKSWPSQWCLEANNLAIQVHGGYGYTREYDVEQHYRDNRLNPIHEGTHGIQSLDLLGRKVTQRGGASLAALGKTVSATSRPQAPPGGEAAELAAQLDGVVATARRPSRRRCSARETSRQRWPTARSTSRRSGTSWSPGSGWSSSSPPRDGRGLLRRQAAGGAVLLPLRTTQDRTTTRPAGEPGPHHPRNARRLVLTAAEIHAETASSDAIKALDRYRYSLPTLVTAATAAAPLRPNSHRSESCPWRHSPASAVRVPRGRRHRRPRPHRLWGVQTSTGGGRHGLSVGHGRDVRRRLPGGSSDLISRAMSKGLSDKLGASFPVINREGANGALAAAEVAKAKPDGSVIAIQNASLFAITPLAVSPDEVTKIDDFDVVYGVSRDDYVLVTSPASGYKYARRHRERHARRPIRHHGRWHRRAVGRRIVVQDHRRGIPARPLRRRRPRAGRGTGQPDRRRLSAGRRGDREHPVRQAHSADGLRARSHRIPAPDSRPRRNRVSTSRWRSTGS